MELSTCSFGLLSIQLTFLILLHTHISKVFKRFISSFLMVHASHPYRTTGHTSVLTSVSFVVVKMILINVRSLLSRFISAKLRDQQVRVIFIDQIMLTYCVLFHL